MKYILIHGLKGHGKSTIADMVEQELLSRGFHTKQLVLADPIRTYLSRTFEIPEFFFEEEETKNIPHPKLFWETPRKVMQMFGTEFAQGCFGKDIWCRILETEALHKEYDYVIIPDIRFVHEFLYFYDKMQSMVFLYREGVKKDIYNKHISESGLMHLYDSINPKMIYSEFSESSTLEGTQEYAKEVLVDLILEGNA